jgi:UDP-N-acetylglucosamine:LPS N-acetylglucosamine transferase
LKQTDIAITRAWATSLWEQNMFGIHSIIIPLNSSAWNHQVHNAKYFNENFESDILNEDEELSSKLEKKLINYKNLRKAWLNLNKFYNALKVIEQNIK